MGYFPEQTTLTFGADLKKKADPGIFSLFLTHFMNYSGNNSQVSMKQISRI